MAINYEFGSDNHSGVHHKIIKAIEVANKDYAVAYGEDEYTKNTIKKFKNHFGKDIEVFFVGNGTAANILGLMTVTNSFNSIICAKTAHLTVHECCGPEKFIGCKLVTIPTDNGKLTTESIKNNLEGFGDVHMAQPKVISITQSTELGTVYTPKEIRTLSNFAHKNKMLLHMDGARLCNAAVSLNCNLSEISGDAGVDILSCGGTKNGMMFGDAVIFFDKKLSKNFEFFRKQGMHLTSKMRFISVQFDEFFKDDLWKSNAKHANKMAKLFYEKIKDTKEIKITQKVESNAIFAILAKKHIKKLQEKYFFHIFNERTNEVRWMCSYNTKKNNVLEFADTIKQVVKN